MSDPVSAAKSARESLARALGAIQSDPGAPAEIAAIAEPISSAMGALFHLERAGGATLASSGPQALEAMRRALALLQQQPQGSPVAATALELVASSLGLIHELVSSAGAAHNARPEIARAPAIDHQAAYAATQIAAGGPGPARAEAKPRAPEGGAAAVEPAGGGDGVAPPRGAGGASSVRIDAELGAHSASNFYKGLSGNDVVDHGGLFIATYKIPRLGQAITVHVSMPGGYEFDAQAVVKWTRETVDSSQAPTAPPGFGAQFTQISPEGRQLVYRYVRNREPLFHDDS